MNGDQPVDPGAGEGRAREPDRSTIPLAGFERPPERIGPYRILEVIGEGGMGTVYLAEQERPVKRRVALKIIKLGMDTKEVIGRFEAERQALAMMDHPNITKVYDAGTTETGRPYFVMEYVQGIPITDYCDQKRLGTRERLGLFVAVCKAIHHAHQKAIIHRDVKPSNVLVTIVDQKPVPKVIDFGVAKAINQRLTERTVYTEHGRLIGTPAYMSPEQADLTGLNVDTTTDVYSLGALLYELLTGLPTFDITELRKVGYEAIQKRIREEDPPKPSTRVSSLGRQPTDVADKRGTSMAGLVRQLRGELDWITMHAMEKDRTRRYASASEFAADVERYLRNEPVLARSPSPGYYLRKMVARHRGPFAFAGASFLIVAGAAVAMTVLWQRSEEAHRAARAEYRRAEGANLLALGRLELERNTSAALAYAMKSLEFSDEEDTRRFIMRALWRGPTMFQLPEYGIGNAVTVRFSPDGRWLAVAHNGGGLFLYPATGEKPRSFVGHDGFVWTIQFLGGDRLLTSASDHTVRLWSVPEGSLLRTWSFDGSVRAYGPPDGRYIYTCEETPGGSSNLWQVWSLEGDEPVRSGRVGHPGGGWLGWDSASAIDPKNGDIALIDRNEIRLVSPDRLNIDRSVLVGTHQGAVSMAFDATGEQLASMNQEGGMRIWQRTERDWMLRREIYCRSGIRMPRFDISGTRVIAGSARDSIPLWDLAGPVGAEPLPVGGRLYSVYDAGFHPSGQWLVSTSDGRMLAAWPLSRVYAHVLGRKGGHFIFSPDGNWVVGECDDCTRLWPLDGRSGQEVRCVFSTAQGLYTLNVDRQSRNLALALDGGDVVIVPVNGGVPRFLKGWTGYAFGAVFDPTGKKVAAYGTDHVDGRDPSIKVWDLDTGDVLTLRSDEGNPGVPVCFTPEGRLITISHHPAVMETGAPLLVWDLKSRSQGILLEGITNWNIGLTPDCRKILYRGVDHRLSLHDFASGKSKDIPTPEGRVVVSALNGTGSMAALGMGDGAVYVIPIDDDMKPHLLLGHEKPIQGVAFDPKGRWLLSWDADYVCRLWPIPEGPPLHSLPRDALLARLGKLTNLRAVTDTSLATGYRVEAGKFPGWDPVPTW